MAHTHSMPARWPRLVRINFADDQHAALEDLATRRQTTVSALVRESVALVLDGNQAGDA